MNEFIMNFKIGGQVDLLPFLANPTSHYSNARVIRPHLEVRYYRGVELLTTQQMEMLHAERVPYLRDHCPEYKKTNFWIALSANPIIPRQLFKSGRRTYFLFPLELTSMSVNGQVTDVAHFNMDQINGSIQVQYANIVPRNFELLVRGQINSLTPYMDRETRAEFYLQSFNQFIDSAEALSSLPVELYSDSNVKKKAFELVHRLLDKLHIMVDTQLWAELTEYMRIPDVKRVLGTRGEEIQQELDEVTKEIMAMQDKKAQGLWTQEDEDYIKSL